MPSEAAIAFARDYLDRHIRVNEGDVMQLATRLDAFAAERVEAMRERCAKADVWWDYHEPESSIHDPEEVADRCAVGEVFRLHAAKTLPDEFYVAGVDAENRTTYRRATEAEIEAWKAKEAARRERHRADAAALRAIPADGGGTTRKDGEG